MTWPNFISLGRLLTVPLIIWLLLTDRMMIAFITFVIAGLSDILDGLLARALKVKSTVGAFLDPLADKVLLMGVFITLGFKHLIPLWLVIVVTFRDALIIGGVILFILLNKKISIHPVFISKINTLLQILLVTITIAQECFPINFSSVVYNLVFLTAATTVFSGAQYVILWIRKIKEEDL